MQRRYWITMLVWAGGTFALALALVLPGSLNATDGGNTLKPKIAQPVINNNGVELSVVADDGPATRPATRPTYRVKLVAINRSNTTQTVPATQVMYQASLTEPMARTAPARKPVWQDKEDVVLAPGQKIERVFDTGVQLKPKMIYAVTLGSGKQNITALTPQLPQVAADQAQASAR